MSSIRDFIPLAKLGQGTFSTVYKVRRLSDQNIYALKKVRMNNLSQKQKENALNQIRILASFEHNNIIAYKQAFFDDKLHVLCIVMQYADGGDLHKYISNTKKDFRRISQITIWKVAADILSALDHLHSKGILHRDLKCANIFIHKDQYKLGDLNVSKVNGGKLAYTQTGTPYYASPQVWRDQPYDYRSDIWSFGCILYEMACLRPPFQGKNMDQLYQNVQKNTYNRIPQDYSSQLAQVISKCLQKNSKNRPKASQLLEHNVISKFKNRKNNLVNQQQASKQLLRTIKLPNDLKSLKMNLPGSKYQSNKNLPPQNNQFKEKVNVKDYISDRQNYLNKNLNYLKNNEVVRNQSLVVNASQKKMPVNKLENYSEAFLSPRNIRKAYQGYNVPKSPEDLIAKKIFSNNTSNSQKKNNSIDYTDRKDNINYKNPSNNFSDRKLAPSQYRELDKKNLILEKYDKFLQHELEKRPAALPRTQKRIVSSQGRYQVQNSNLYVSTPENNPMDKKDLQQWKKKLVKKSRVFSNNIISSRPVYPTSSQAK